MTALMSLIELEVVNIKKGELGLMGELLLIG